MGHHRAPDTDRDDDEQAKGPRVRIAHTRNKACNRGARIAQEPRVVLGSLRNKRPGLSGRPPCKAIFEGILWCLESNSVLQNAINWAATHTWPHLRAAYLKAPQSRAGHGNLTAQSNGPTATSSPRMMTAAVSLLGRPLRRLRWRTRALAWPPMPSTVRPFLAGRASWCWRAVAHFSRRGRVRD